MLYIAFSRYWTLSYGLFRSQLESLLSHKQRNEEAPDDPGCYSGCARKHCKK